MTDHGTAIFPDWYITFQQAALAALPRPPHLDQDIGLGWAGNGEALTKAFAEALLPKVLMYSANGVVFDLTLDGDAAENDPIEMARRDGYSNIEKWKYTGKRVNGLQTRSFMLVSVGYCASFPELIDKLVKYGTIPEGQWRGALMAAYKSDERGFVGVADSSWVNPHGSAGFPYIGTHGRSSFGWTDSGFGDSWRWLVGVGK